MKLFLILEVGHRDALGGVAAAPTSAWKRSGYWVAEWLPQMVMRLMSVTAAPVLAASCEIARLWSEPG